MFDEAEGDAERVQLRDEAEDGGGDATAFEKRSPFGFSLSLSLSLSMMMMMMISLYYCKQKKTKNSYPRFSLPLTVETSDRRLVGGFEHGQ